MPACPRCGQENVGVAQFCMACGTRLRDTAPARGEERKVVTVLFCDLVAFTTRADRSDPEDVRATLSSYFVRLRAAIERFGGTVEKFIGDAVVAVFGAPLAHEDDPERAVRCAFAMLGAIGELNRLSSPPGLAVRIGVTTGETLVALGAEAVGEGIVAGDVVNVAARLQMLAPEGAVVVDDATYRATRSVADFEDFGDVVVKGKARPVHVWRPTGFRSRFGTDVDHPSATPFIGRDDELEVLKRTFARAVREPSVQLVTIMGEPGVGKSRLVRELFVHTDSLPDLIHWRQGRCLAYGDAITYWALAQIVRAHAGILATDGADAAAAKLDAAVNAVVYGPERGWIASRLAPLVGIGQSDGAFDPAEHHAAWRAFLEAVASVRPSVFVFEDLHWAGRPMLAFVEHLVEWAGQVPMLVVCTARPELYEVDPAWGGGKRNSSTISLAPLALTETAELVSALVPEARLTVESKAELLERAGGNPLYAEEFAQMLKERPWPSSPTPPESLHAIIAARLDALPRPLKGLLQTASVVGKVFWVGALVGDGWDRARVEEGLHELARRELVRRSRVSSVEGEAEFGFWHDLIRDVAYTQIPRAARGSAHRAVARWIEALAGERPLELAELLAYHDAEALTMARATGSADIEDLERRSRRSLLRAGEAAMRLDVPRAVVHFDRALELVQPGAPGRAEVLLASARAWARQGRFERAESLYEAASREARDAGNPRQAGDALVGLAAVLWHRGETVRHRVALEEGVELLEGAGPSEELARAYADQAFTDAVTGRLRDAAAWADKTLAIADELDLPQIRAQALAFRGGARGELGDLGGLEDLRDARRITTELGLARETAQADVIASGVLAVTDGPHAALEALEAGIAVTERRGITDMAMGIHAETLRPLFDLGEWDRVVEIAGRVSAWSRAHGGGYFDVFADIATARVAVRRGASPPPSASFVAAARGIGDLPVLVPALAVGATVEANAGDVEAAARLIDELDGVISERSDWYLVPYVPEIVRVGLAVDRRAFAERIVEAMGDSLAQRANAQAAGRAEIAGADGRPREAAELFLESSERWRGSGLVPELAEALFGCGRSLAGAGDAGAAARLEEARTLFAALGAQPSVEAVGRWLGATPPASDAGAPIIGTRDRALR